MVAEMPSRDSCTGGDGDAVPLAVLELLEVSALGITVVNVVVDPFVLIDDLDDISDALCAADEWLRFLGALSAWALGQEAWVLNDLIMEVVVREQIDPARQHPAVVLAMRMALRATATTDGLVEA